MASFIDQGLLYIMDLEVIPYSLNYVIGNWDHFGLHQGNNVTMTVEFEVSKRFISKPTLSIAVVQHVLRWERLKRLSRYQ